MSTANSNLARIPSASQTPASFVSGLPKVSYTDLPDHECCICREDFDARQGTDDVEVPVRLPCGHIFGEKCLLAFLSIGTIRHSCPMCRGQLPLLTDHPSRKSEEHAFFLNWIALHHHHLGAALDRQYAVLKAIEQANFYLTAMANCYDLEDGRLTAIDQEFIALMYQIAGLDPQNPIAWQRLEGIHEGLDRIMPNIESSMYRSVPLVLSSIPRLRPWVGRKIALTTFILETETETPLLPSSPLEDGEILSFTFLEITHRTTSGAPIPEHAPITSPHLPPDIRAALQADFAGLTTAEIWDTLRSRRFAGAVPCREGEVLQKLAAWLYVSDEILAEYAREELFTLRGPRRESRWQLNAGSDTLECVEEWV